MEKHIASLVEFEQEAARFAGKLSPLLQRATLVTLSGELGAGKTTFTQAVAKALGVEDLVTSPTFVLEKIYKPQGKGFSRLIHIDAYRLKNSLELGALGFDEVMGDPGNLVMLEWPEHVAESVAEPTVKISLTVNENGTRTLAYD